MGKIFSFHIFHENLAPVHQASECENPLAWLNYYLPKTFSPEKLLTFFLSLHFQWKLCTISPGWWTLKSFSVTALLWAHLFPPMKIIREKCFHFMLNVVFALWAKVKSWWHCIAGDAELNFFPSDVKVDQFIKLFIAEGCLMCKDSQSLGSEKRGGNWCWGAFVRRLTKIHTL